MKKITKQVGNNPIEGINIIIKRTKDKDSPLQTLIMIPTIKNPDNHPLIEQINELEEKYLEIVSQNWLKNKTKLSDGGSPSGIRIYYGKYLENKMIEILQEFQKEFYRIEGHQGKKLKAEDEILKAYIAYLEIEIKELHIKINVKSSKENAKNPKMIRKSGLEHKSVILKGGKF